MNNAISKRTSVIQTKHQGQLFEGRLALNPRLNLTLVSFSFVQKHFLGQFSLIFIEHQIINLLTKITKLNLVYKLSYLNSNFALTLGYLNPALNNPAQGFSRRQEPITRLLETPVTKNSTQA